MAIIKKFIESLLGHIDSGKFFREPMKWYYMVQAILCILISLAAFIVVYDQIPLEHIDGWAKVMAILFLICTFIVCFTVAVFSYYFWTNRRGQLHNQVKEGDPITAIPVWAHSLQSGGEWFGIFIGIVPTLIVALMYICALLSGFKMSGLFSANGEAFLKVFILGLLIVIGVAVVCAVFGYSIILISHVVGEKLRIKAMLANDVRNIGDIHRAAVMTNDMPQTPAAPAE